MSNYLLFSIKSLETIVLEEWRKDSRNEECLLFLFLHPWLSSMIPRQWHIRLSIISVALNDLSGTHLCDKERVTK